MIGSGSSEWKLRSIKSPPFEVAAESSRCWIKPRRVRIKMNLCHSRFVSTQSRPVSGQLRSNAFQSDAQWLNTQPLLFRHTARCGWLIPFGCGAVGRVRPLHSAARTKCRALIRLNRDHTAVNTETQGPYSRRKASRLSWRWCPQVSFSNIVLTLESDKDCRHQASAGRRHLVRNLTPTIPVYWML